MSAAELSPRVPLSEPRLLLRCACVAIIVELLFLEALGVELHWFAHPQKSQGLDPDHFVEAQMVQLPETPELTSPSEKAIKGKAEVAISRQVGKGRKATDLEKKSLSEPTENLTKAPGVDTTLPPTHGPVAVYTPSPVIPSYLTNEELKRTVVIEFFVTAQGAVTPRLIGSSDNEELDAIAVETAKKWQFRPAEENHKIIDSKVRLRIVFEVK